MMQTEIFGSTGDEIFINHPSSIPFQSLRSDVMDWANLISNPNFRAYMR